MGAYRFIVLAGISLATGCGRSSSVSQQLQAVGGAATLIRDCQTLLAEQRRTHKDTWSAGDTNLPATVGALRPQVVQAAHYDGLPVVDIQISGGFTHRGVLVILTNTPPGFVPRKSSWRVTKIADGIFEYRE